MASASQGKSRISPLTIGALLGLGLVLIFWLGSGSSSKEPDVEPHPWQVLTINNSSIDRGDLPLRVICSTDLDQSAADAGTVADCYLRASLQYNPSDDLPRLDDCRLGEGFVVLTTGSGEAARLSQSRAVDISSLPGGCPQRVGVVRDVVFRFQQVDRSASPTAIRFEQLEPLIELKDNLNFIVDYNR